MDIHKALYKLNSESATEMLPSAETQQPLSAKEYAAMWKKENFCLGQKQSFFLGKAETSSLKHETDNVYSVQLSIFKVSSRTY